MKVNENGVYREMTEAEEAEYEKLVREQTPKAKNKIENGAFFTMDGIYYAATTTIPAGDFIIPVTNCNEISPVSVHNALNA